MTKIPKRPSLDDVDDVPQEEKVEMSLWELAEMIEDRWASIPAKSNKKAFHLWKKQMNSLVDEYNKRVGFKAFKNAK